MLNGSYSEKPYLAWFLIIGLVLLGLSTALASMDTVSEAEESIFYFFYDLPDNIETFITSLAIIGTFGVVLITIGLAIWQKRYARALLVIPSVAGGYAITYAIKMIVERGRPAELLGIVPRGEMDTARDGFPSGHVTIAMVVAVLLFFQLPSHWRFRLLFLLVPLAVGVSRIYLGEHMPLDVVGGAGVGLLVGCALEFGRNRLAPQS